MDETLDLREFIAKYGERGYYIIKAILDASLTGGKAKLGDFDLKGIKERLKSMGLDYNPVPLLYALERTYGVIRTTYRSTTQHWWEITDRRKLQEILSEFEGSRETEDYELRLLRLQFYSLDPERILAQLRSSRRPRQLVARMAFTTLPMIVEFLKKAKELYPEELAKEIDLAEQILELAERAITRGALNSKAYLITEAEVQDDALGGSDREPL
jgi:hypothetical protein